MESEVGSTNVSGNSGVESNNCEVFTNSAIDLESSQKNDSSSCGTDITNKSGASPKLHSEENKNVKNLASGNDETPGDCMYFYEDEVFRIDKKGRVKFGVILETAVEQNDTEDKLLSKGEVRISWCVPENNDVYPESSVRYNYF